MKGQSMIKMMQKFWNDIKLFFQKLIEYRWFYSFSASLTATVVGISLTFGINSCRDERHKVLEAEKSVMEAVSNISIRIDQLGRNVDLLENQNNLYFYVDSLFESGMEIPDSVCVIFKDMMPRIQTNICDHGFEKVFRETYQLWQVLDQNKLTNLIDECFEVLNYTEPLSNELLESMIDQIVMCNDDTPLNGTDARFFTEAMLNRPKFQFYMSLRMGKVNWLKSYYMMLEHMYQRIEDLCDEYGYVFHFDDDSEHVILGEDGIVRMVEHS